jgi:hypothetical protein
MLPAGGCWVDVQVRTPSATAQGPDDSPSPGAYVTPAGMVSLTARRDGSIGRVSPPVVEASARSVSFHV